MSEYSASTLNVSANYMGEQIPCEITNISWNGQNFNGQLDGINITGSVNGSQLKASGNYFGHNYSASGTVTGWN